MANFQPARIGGFSPRSFAETTHQQLPPQPHDDAAAAATSLGDSPDQGMASPEPSFDHATDASSSGPGGGVVGFPLRRFGARSGNTPVEFALIPCDSPLVPSRTHGFPQDRRASAPVPDPHHPTHWHDDGAADDGDGLGTRQDSTVTVASATSDGGDPVAPPSVASSVPLHLHAQTEGFAADGPDDLIQSLFELLIDPTTDGETSPGNLPATWDFLRTLTRSELRDARERGRQSASGPREFINGITAAAYLLCMKDADDLHAVSHAPGVIAIVTVRVCSRDETSHSKRLAEQLRIFRQSHHKDWFARAGPHARVLYHLMIGSRGWGATGMLLPITQDTIATHSQLLRGVEEPTAPPPAWANWQVHPPQSAGGDTLVSDELGGGNLTERHQQRATSVPDEFVTNAIDDLVKYRAVIQARLPGVTGCSVPFGITRHRGDPPTLLHRVACHDVTLLSEPEACQELCAARDDAWGSVLHFAACTGQVHWFRTWMMVLFGDRSKLTLDLPDNFQEYLCDREGRTVLDCAAASGSARMLQHCLTNWSAWTYGVSTRRRVDALRLARHAAMGGCPEVLRMSLPSPTTVTTEELTLLVAHAALGDNFIAIVETIRALCMPGMTTSNASLCALTRRLTERTPAHYAARGGNPESLKLVCSWQSAYHVPDAHGCTIFHHALRSGKIGCVEAAIDLMMRANGSSPRWRLWADNAGHRPIHFAAWSGNAELMEWVAKEGDITRELPSRARGLKLLTTAWSGATGIHFVARSGNVKLFERFRLEHQGAIRCWKPSQWSLLLEYAAAGGTPDMVCAVVNAARSANALRSQDELPTLRRRLAAMAKQNPGYPVTMAEFIASPDFEILYRRWAPTRG